MRGAEKRCRALGWAAPLPAAPLLAWHRLQSKASLCGHPFRHHAYSSPPPRRTEPASGRPAVTTTPPSGCNVVDCGDRLGKWSGKCLQASLLSLVLCNGEDSGDESDVATSLLRLRGKLLMACSNPDGAGLGGTLREARNLSGVHRVLVSERCALCVVAADTCDDFYAGRGLSRWYLGASDLPCIGAVLWPTGAPHVCALLGDGVAESLARIQPGGDNAVAPWVHTVAAGKQSRRSRAGRTTPTRQADLEPRRRPRG